MRKRLRPLGRIILGWLTKLTILKHHPTVIGIVGDGPTSIVRETIYVTLSQTFPTRRNLETPEVEFSLPLTVLGTTNYPKNTLEWVILCLSTLVRIIKIKPYRHFLILEMSPAKKETLNYWLAITNPRLIVACGNIPEWIKTDHANILPLTDDSLTRIFEISLKVAVQFGADARAAKKALDKIVFYPTRLRFFSAAAGPLIVDATHYFYPTPLKAAVELIEKFPGRKLIITTETVQKPPEGFEIVEPEMEPLEVRSYSAIIIRGKRTERFDLLERLTGGNYE